MKQIVLTEDVRLPKSGIILEKGDIVNVLSEEEWDDYDVVDDEDFFPEDPETAYPSFWILEFHRQGAWYRPGSFGRTDGANSGKLPTGFDPQSAADFIPSL